MLATRAYLNAGTDGPLPARSVAAARARLDHELGEGRSGRVHWDGLAALSEAVRGVLEQIAACESHGNPRAIGGGGAFRGKYQFTYGTWASVGGKGDPAAAPEAEQDRRAAILLRRTGGSAWPVCA